MVEKKKKPSFRLKIADWALFLGPMLPLIFGLLALAYQVELSQCPVGTFLAGTVKDGLQLVWLLGLSLSLISCFRHIVITHVPALNAAFGDRSGLMEGNWWLWFTLAASLAFAVLSVIASLSVYCLSDTKIVYRDSPTGPMRSFAWQDIAGIQTGCHHYVSMHGRVHDDSVYNLVMRDGTIINILDNARYTEAAWPRIVKKLEHVPFWFNDAGVEPECSFPRTDLLLTRP